MGIINILDSKIYNKIAAGEVVERPSAVVKELLDNSIDAGGNDIKIEIKGGGLKFISVKDNASGIAKEDIRNAFLPHATSKICDEKDLFAIKTLGFRGEALASIAAVSNVEMSSATKEGEEGVFLRISGGTVEEEKECAINKGTSITVQNLFFNTPARLKFLKSERAEESDIINIVSRYILANPNIRIKLTINGKNIFQSFGQGLKEAISCIYGSSVLGSLAEINVRKGDFTIFGYIGFPSFSKPNRTYQTLALNGRYIINSTISAAITNAYGDFLLKRQYPFYVIHISTPADFVDVNVHPNKMDVRFEDNKRIFSLFYNAIYEKLHSTMQSIVHYETPMNNDNGAKRIDNIDNKKEETSSYIKNIIERYDRPDTLANPSNLKVRDIYNEEIKPFNDEITDVFKSKKDEGEAVSFVAGDIEKVNNKDNIVYSENINVNSFVKQTQNSLFDSEGINLYKIKCVLFNTYLVLEFKDNLLIIDQHAAHERILYDKFKEAYEAHENAIQNLIVPYLLTLNTKEFDFLYDNKGLLEELGFGIELFGDNVFKISAVPFILSGIDLKGYFDDLLKDINFFKQFGKTTDFIKDELMKKACRAAVKAGDKLEKNEIDFILKTLFDSKVLLCPHGRPIVQFYTKQQLEKLFKRIV